MTTQTNETYTKPLPEADPEDRPYWESLKRHAMEIQRCSECGEYTFLPKPLCPNCLADALVWTRVSGRGTVWGTTTQSHPPLPSFSAEDMPFNISLVELAEGVRVCTNVIGCPVEDVRIGMEVEVVYDDVTDDVTLARFRPVKDQ
ncbi:MAG: OB-fold domain-containing protein [Actinobacteria bacterium]|nr:OB-fold domain-containing protein [Actinomycetota bacterium]